MDETLDEQPSIVKKIPEPEKKLPWVAPSMTRIETEAQGNDNRYVDRGIRIRFNSERVMNSKKVESAFKGPA